MLLNSTVIVRTHTNAGSQQTDSQFVGNGKKSISKTADDYQEFHDPGWQSDRGHGFVGIVKDIAETRRLFCRQHAEETPVTSPHDHDILVPVLPEKQN